MRRHSVKRNRRGPTERRSGHEKQVWGTMGIDVGESDVVVPSREGRQNQRYGDDGVRLVS